MDKDRREYNVGDKVKIKRVLDLVRGYPAEPFVTYPEQNYEWFVDFDMSVKRGMIGIITKKDTDYGYYVITFDDGKEIKYWTSGMFDLLEAEKEIIESEISPEDLFYRGG